MTREVHEHFIERWAKRYGDIYHAHGELAARSWLTSFVNAEDIPRVLIAVQERRTR